MVCHKKGKHVRTSRGFKPMNRLEESKVAQRPTVDDEFGSEEKVDNYADRDRKLQLSRRIDWRFLLPSLDLHRVAYIGPEGGAQPVALNQFCDSLKIIHPPYHEVYEPGHHSKFELVVLHSRDLADIEKARMLLVPGGYLYWEIAPRKWRSFLREMTKSGTQIYSRQNPIWKECFGSRHFRHYVESLERHGLCTIQVNWHRPNFESCLEIIPLNNPKALDYVFARGASNLMGQIKLLAGRYLMKAHLLAHLVSCVSVIAYKHLPGTESL